MLESVRMATHESAPHLLRTAVADPELPWLLAASKLAPVVVDRPRAAKGVGSTAGFWVGSLA